MAPKFRESEFIDFNSGTVKVAPIQLQYRMRMAGETALGDLVRLYQCRVEVWHLGVAAQMVNSIEYGQPPSVWSHAAYSVIAVLVNYFETIGRILSGDANLTTPTDLTAAASFEAGFHDIYPNLTASSGKALLPQEFHTRMRNGLFALGSSPRGLWVHNAPSISTQDFDVIQKNPADASTLKYYINPHSTVRTIIDHFPTVITRLNNPDAANDALRARLRKFMGDLGAS